MTILRSASRPHSYIEPLQIRARSTQTQPKGLPVINLSFNESPFAPSPAVASAIAAAAAKANYYGEPSCEALRQKIAHAYGLHSERIICGNGSEELLDIVGRLFAGVGDEIIISEYGYIQFPIVANRVGATLVKAREKSYTADVDALLAAVTPKTKLVFIADPNNPTGTRIGEAGLRRLAAELPSDVVLVIDLAYGEFAAAAGDDYCAAVHELTADLENVIVTRTFSKAFGLAGLRVGWCYAPEWMLPGLYAARAMGPVNAAAQAAAVAALAELDDVRLRVNTIISERNRVTKALSGMGLHVVASSANFLLCGLSDDNSAANVLAAEKMAQHLFDDAGILVNQTREAGLEHFIRFSLSVEDHNTLLVNSLRKFLDD